MKKGKKSLLFGVHQFLIHPLSVFVMYVRLFGWTWDVKKWLAIFVHDWGYWDCENMDDEKGVQHPKLGGDIMHRFDEYMGITVYAKVYCDGNKDVGSDIQMLYDEGYSSPEYLPNIDAFRLSKELKYSKYRDFTQNHSSFYINGDMSKASELYYADKLSVLLYPDWLYLLLGSLSGEIDEYIDRANDDERKEHCGIVPYIETDYGYSWRVKKKWLRWYKKYIATKMYFLLACERKMKITDRGCVYVMKQKEKYSSQIKHVD